MHDGAFVLSITIAVAAAAPQKSEREQAAIQRQAKDHYQKGQNALASERVEQAIPEFKAAIQLDPLLAQAYYGLGQAHMILKNYPEAERDFLDCHAAYERIASLSFTNREDLERRRRDEIEELQNELSSIQSGQVKSSNPSLPMQLRQRIEELQYSQRKGGEGASIVPAGVMVSLGSAYFRQGRLDEAEKQWKAAIEANPKQGEAHNNLAALYLMANEPKEADKELKLAEKSGYSVHPRLKDDIKKALKAAAEN